MERIPSAVEVKPHENDTVKYWPYLLEFIERSIPIEQHRAFVWLKLHPVFIISRIKLQQLYRKMAQSNSISREQKYLT